MRRRLSSSPFLGVALVYLMVHAVSSLVGEDVENGLGTVAGTAKALIWPVVIVMLLLSRPNAPVNVARAFALTLAALSGLTLVQEFLFDNATTFAGLANVPLVADLGGATSRHAGPQGDANFWGRVLVLGLPFALSLAAMAVSRLERLVWAGCAVLILGGVVLTGSRGALLAAAVVVVLWALFTGGRAAKALLFAPVVMGAGFFVPGVGSRLLTLSAVSDTTLAVGDPSLEGRVAAQRVAFHVFMDHPILGVGPGNFIAVAPQYLRKLGLNTTPLAPHNSYLEAGAEGGLLGLLAWLLLLGAAVFVVVRARLLARAGGPVVDRDATPVSLSNAVLAALAGWAVASLFLHVATFRTFLLVAALGAALDIRARRRVAQLLSEGRVVAVPRPVVVRRRRTPAQALARYVVAPAVSCLVLIAGALWAFSGPPTTTWSATTSLQLVVKFDRDSQSPAYDLDTLSRAALVRTLSGIATSPRFVREGADSVRSVGGAPDGVTVEISGSSASALVVVVATGPTSKQAADMSQAVRGAAVAYLNTVSPLYGALPVAGPPVVDRDEPRFDRDLALVPLAVAAAIIVVFAAGLGIGAVRAHRRRPHADDRTDLARSGHGGPSRFT